MNNDIKLKKFEELAEKRVNEAIKRLRIIGNLANRSNYHYSDAHVRQIYRALEDEFKSLKARFSDIDSDSTSFKFKKISSKSSVDDA